MPDYPKTGLMEQFSYAFVRALTATAGCDIAAYSMDYESVDLTVRGLGFEGKYSNPSIDVQLKATHQDVLVDGAVKFKLKKKNYEDLRAANLIMPKILVVVHIPANQAEWLEQSADRLTLYRCAYWISLRGAPQLNDQESKTIEIPATQQFTVGALQEMLQRVSDGGEP